jgi:hypothetical protein
MSRTIKLQKQPFLHHIRRNFQLSAVTAEHLVSIVVNIVQGHFLYSVGQPHWFTDPGTNSKIFTPLPGKFPLFA